MTAQTPLVAAISTNSTPASSWTPVDLKAVMASDREEERPTLLTRTDGVALLYPGRVHGLHAEPESGKSWATLTACAEAIRAGESVLYVDYEDTPANVTGRLLLLGAELPAVLERFRYVNPDEPADEQEVGRLMAAKPSLVVFDGLTEAFAIEGLSISDNDEIAAWIKRYPRRFARAGAAVVLVDHVTKDREGRGRFAIGGQHKLAGVDVAYSLHVVRPFGRGRDGLVAVKVEKDRPGWVRQHQDDGCRVAMLTVTSGDGGQVSIDVEPPERKPGEPFRPTVLMERISRSLEKKDGQTKREIREVKGSSDSKDLALQLLVAEGYVEPRRDGQALRHYLVKAFRKGPE